MTELIGDILISVTVLLLAILNRHNGKRIDNLEKRVDMLTIRTGGREP